MKMKMMMMMAQQESSQSATCTGKRATEMGTRKGGDWNQNCVNINDIKARLEIKQTTSQIQWTVPRTLLRLQLVLLSDVASASDTVCRTPPPPRPPTPLPVAPLPVAFCQLLPACCHSPIGAIEAQPYCVLCRFSISIHNTRCYFGSFDAHTHSHTHT